MTATKQPTVADVRAVCRELGLPFRRISETKEFCIAGYYTDDAQDAIATARHMANRTNALIP